MQIHFLQNLIKIRQQNSPENSISKQILQKKKLTYRFTGYEK